jgi:hypothetical protein
MNGGMTKSVAVWTLCLSGSAVIQIWPRIQGVFWPTPGLPAQGVQGEVGWIVIQVVVLIVMAGIPKAMESVESKGKKAVGWTFGVLLFVFSLYLGQEGVNHLRELITGPRQGVQAEATRLDHLITGLESQKAGVPEFIYTTQPEVDALVKAAGDAKRTREQECEKLGPNCRTRQNEEAASNEKVTEANRHLGRTQRADDLSGKINAAKAARVAIIVPKDADPSAARAAQVTGYTVDEIADWFPVFTAGLLELLAFLGPWLLLGKNTEVKRQDAAPAEVKQEAVTDPSKGAEPRQGVVSGGSARGLRAKASTTRKPEKPTVQGVKDPSTVREWRAACVSDHQGGRYQSSEAFKMYGEWCEGRGVPAVNIKVWGTMMKDELAMRHEKDSSDRTFYLDIRIASRPKLVAAK